MAEPVIEDPAVRAYVDGLKAEIDKIQRGGGEAIAAERKIRQAAESERDKARLAAEQATTEAAAKLAAMQADAEAWKSHTAELAKARAAANAERLAALPEAARDTITSLGLDDERLSKLLTTMPAVVPPAAPADPSGQQPAKPVIPPGGAVPGSQPSDRLAPEIERWVREQRKDLIGVSVAAAEAAYKSFGPGAKAP